MGLPRAPAGRGGLPCNTLPLPGTRTSQLAGAVRSALPLQLRMVATSRAAPSSPGPDAKDGTGQSLSASAPQAAKLASPDPEGTHSGSGAGHFEYADDRATAAAAANPDPALPRTRSVAQAPVNDGSTWPQRSVDAPPNPAAIADIAWRSREEVPDAQGKVERAVRTAAWQAGDTMASAA